MKVVMGLEHCVDLAQVDLSFNCITNPIGVRLLSFNRALHALSLEGNPLARNRPGFRAAVTALLPHVTNIDGTSRPAAKKFEPQRSPDEQAKLEFKVAREPRRSTACVWERGFGPKECTRCIHLSCVR